MIVIPTALGIKRSFFELILNSKLFMVIARISFCTYLVHLMVLYQVIYVQNNDFYYDLTIMFEIYMGVLVLSLLLGFLLTVLVEVPLSNLLKSIMKNRMKSDC
jgi:peptidoglycan/LPS O-acetylase OafA/YrhL